jgi:hypothetical protein
MTALAVRLVPAAVAALVAGAAFVVAMPGCSFAEDDSIRPVDPPTGAIGGGASGAGGAGPASPRVRIVGTRSPWAGVPGNLLLDGDFELSAGAGNSNWPGWRAWGAASGSPSLETGGICRSGLHCAVVDSGIALLGWSVAANGSAMMGSIWAKVPEGRSCDVVTVGMLAWTRMNRLSDLFAPAQPEPDVDGWCRYERFISARQVASFLYVEVDLPGGETALLDDARLIPTTGVAPMSATTTQPTAAQIARAQAAAEWARSKIRFARAQYNEPPSSID